MTFEEKLDEIQAVLETMSRAEQRTTLYRLDRIYGKKRLPPGVRDQILARDGHECRRCGAAEHLEIDHIIPESRGGDEFPDNLQVLCWKCNSRKGSQMPQEKV